MTTYINSLLNYFINKPLKYAHKHHLHGQALYFLFECSAPGATSYGMRFFIELKHPTSYEVSAP